jgi:dephospho-CoA kinase
MNKIIIGLAGEIASGKGTAAKYIKEKYNGSSHRFSTVLRDVIRRMYLKENRENMQKISTMLRDYFGSDILSKIIYHDVENDSHEIVAIDGVRRLEDIEFLKNLSGFKLVYVEADMKKRYGRIKQRGENTDDAGKTFEEFENDHKKEAELEIKALKDKADMIVDNNGNFEDLYSQIDKIVESCKN